MTTDTHSDEPGTDDEIALPRFEHRLRLRLADAHRRHLAAPAPPTPRPAARRSLQVGASVIAVAATVVAVAIVTRDADVPVRRGPDRATPAPDDLATRVISASQEADATMVVHVSEDKVTPGEEAWYDETTGARRFLEKNEDGSPSLDFALVGNDRVTVDHCFAEFARQKEESPAASGSATSWVQDMLMFGELVEDGTEVVDGRELIRLKEVPLQATGPGEPTTTTGVAPAESTEPPVEASGPYHVLVDPDTFRPVQVLGYGNDASVQTYEYLPRTPENLAFLEAPVPTGFSEVPQLRSNGERADADCV